MKPSVDATQREPCCKVGRVLQDYELGGFGEELVARWTGDDASLRELQRALNRRVIEHAMRRAGQPPLEGEAERLRSILAEGEVSETQRIEARRRLENQGVDVEQLEGDFVSHQSIYNHFRECLDVEKQDGQTDAERLESARSTVFGLQQRTQLVTEQTVSHLASNDQLTPEGYDVLVDVQAICRSCGRSYAVDELLEAGGCRACRSDHKPNPE